MIYVFLQVGREFTCRLDLDGLSSWKVPDFFPAACSMVSSTPTHRDAVVNAFVYVHQTLHKANARLSKRGGRTMAITPRYDYFIMSINSKDVIIGNRFCFDGEKNISECFLRVDVL